MCRRLETQGDLRRFDGPAGKIVNSIPGAETPLCLCGCGAPVRHNYRPGHDARHAARVGRQLAERGPDVSPELEEELIRSLPTDALRSKARGMGERAWSLARQQRSQISDPVVQVEPATSTALGEPGSSHEQRAAEGVMLQVLGARLDADLKPRRIVHKSGTYVEVDGASPTLDVLVECWAHQGTAKVAQRNKLVTDAVKLAWIAGTVDPTPSRLILCVSDEAAVAHLRGRSWQGAAIRDLGVDIEVVELPVDVVRSVEDAQKRQYR